MTTIDRASAISYLAELYKTAGDGKKILPDVFTAAVCDICDVSFVENHDSYVFKDGDKYYVPAAVENIFELKQLTPKVKHSFETVCAFVKWDLIHQKLKELNHA